MSAGTTRGALTGTLLAVLAAALLLAAPAAPAAQARIGLQRFDSTFVGPPAPGAETGALGPLVYQAGTHPYALHVSLAANTVEEEGKVYPDEQGKDVEVANVEGFAGNPGAVPLCASAQFLIGRLLNLTECSDSSAIGMAEVEVSSGGKKAPLWALLYNLVAPPGAVAKFGFRVGTVSVTIDIGLSEEPPYRVIAHTTNISQALEFLSADLTIWGVPADPLHDIERGTCGSPAVKTETCPASIAEVPFLTMPRACTGPLQTGYAVDSWLNPGARLANGEADLSDPAWVSGSVLSHDEATPPNPQGMIGCGKLAFAPKITAQPTSRAAESSSGLDFGLGVEDLGLENPEEGATAASDIRKAVVTLPEGMTANPSSAAGLEVCSEAQLAQITAESPPGTGCPEASKLGTVEVETPLLEGKLLKGSLFLAKPYANPFGSLLALYVAIQSPELGIKVIQPLKVEPDPSTGRLITSAEEMPQLPFSHFRLHFREGARSPLVTPPACGTYSTEATLYPWAGGAPVTSNSAFQIITGPGEGSCPTGGTPPFRPGFEAGSINNNAGSYSPFDMRLTRNDGDQDLTKFSAKLPPGMIGKLAGTSECPAGAIAQARSRTGQNGGHEESEHPSCPASSQIGRVLAGAGVGSVLTYVPGQIYLAGPYKGAPLSVVAIVPALAGPFDAGTVVTQEALRINPLTAEVEADGSSSDPIPHILKGIPLKVRDIRVYVDKPDFTLNPTSCAPSQVGATLWSGGLNVFSALDDSPHSLTTPFQAADCASLGFKPRLALALKGGTKRGGHPALTGTYTPRPGDANLKSLVLRLPRSAFLDQAHIRTICTRVQFAANGGNGAGCPAGAIYGKATAYTPILDQPLSGPVFLRSSNHNLPDFVAALHGTIDVEAVARIDSKGGGIRATFPTIPDAPLSKVVVQMQGAKKGLIVNSRNLCGHVSKADAQFGGHNGRRFGAKPVVEASCGGERKGKRQRGQ